MKRPSVRCSKPLFAAGLALISATFLPAQSNYPTPYTFTTLVGGTANLGGAVPFSRPNGVAVDSNGNLFLADTGNEDIRKITLNGVVTTLAGSTGASGSNDGSGSGAKFNGPFGVAVDSSGYVYVADTYNDTIRKIAPDGVVTTLAGSVGSNGSTDGTGTAALFNTPQGVAVDGNANVYVADTGNETIRKITPDGGVTTLAGLADNLGNSDGTGSTARFNAPQGVTADDFGNVYVADTGNETIRKITPDGGVITLAGSVGQTGTSDGTGSEALFSEPVNLAVDGGGTLYVADYTNDTIRKVAPDGVVTTLAGSPGQSGNNDGIGSSVRFSNLSGVAVDANGYLYVTDSYTETLRLGAYVGADPFAGTTLGSGWYHSSWFGDYNNANYPWINHAQHGFMYVLTTNDTDIYLFDQTLGWLYTTPGLYPELYSYGSTGWLYYEKGTSNPRYFYNFALTRWQLIQP